MNKNILGLRTVIYRVPDLQEAKKWYSDVFGKGPYFDESFYIGFEIGGYELGLYPDDTPPEEKTDNIETYWGVTDIKSEHQRFLDKGASEHTGIQNVGGELLVSTLRDPWGNVIGLIYNPYFKLS